MLTLLINGKAVEFYENSTFSLTRENPLLTGSEDYSFDLTLPLYSSLGNQSIFGDLHLPNATMPTSPFSFRLVVDELEVAGLAYVERCTDKDLSLRLVAGRSTLASIGYVEGKPTYLDELRAVDGWYNVYEPTPTESRIGVKVLPSMRRYERLAIKTCRQAIFNPTNKTIYDFASSPLRNREENPSAEKYLREKTKELAYPPQMQLLDLLKVLLNHFGFTLIIPAESPSWWQLVYVANSRLSNKWQHLLPHWTMGEFIQEVEAFFCARFEVRGKEIRMWSRWQFSSRKVSLQLVADERVCTLEKKEKKSHPASLRYDLPDAPAQMVLPQHVIDQSDVYIVDTSSQMVEHHAELLKGRDSLAYRALYLLRENGTKYAYLKDYVRDRYQLQQVDSFAPYSPNVEEGISRDAARSLRIVPARRDEFHIVKPESFSISGTFSIDKEINPRTATNEKVASKPDGAKVMEVFLKDPHERDLLVGPPYPLGTTHGYIDEDSGLYKGMPTKEAVEAFFLANKIPSQELSRADASVAINATFADRLPNPQATDIYHFNGNDYLCRKLTIKMDVYGMLPLIEGEFHPLA